MAVDNPRVRAQTRRLAKLILIAQGIAIAAIGVVLRFA